MPDRLTSRLCPGAASAVLWLAFVVVLVVNCRYLLRQPVWAPRNEIAHYDYIDQLSSLRIPQPWAPISDYSREITLAGLNWKQPPGFDGSAASMGVEGMSYEVHQPPLYYAILAAPNALLKAVGCPAARQIATLRLLQYGFVVGGALLLVPLLVELAGRQRWGFLAGQMLATTVLAMNLPTQATLGNDNLSPLVGTAAFLCWTMAFSRRDARWLCAASWLVALAFLTKYTNLGLVPLHLLACGGWIHREGRRDAPRIARSLALAGLLAVAWVGGNLLLHGEALKTGASMKHFAEVVVPVKGRGRFLGSLIVSAFSARQFGLLVEPGWLQYLAGGLAANLAIAGYRVGTRRADLYDAAVLAAGVLTVGLWALAVALNELKPGVWWGAFRHFSGYGAAWYFAWFGYLVRVLEPRIPRDRRPPGRE